MNLRITANYPATDGSMPESVDVEWTDVQTVEDCALALDVLDRLITAPSKVRHVDARLTMPDASA